MLLSAIFTEQEIIFPSDKTLQMSFISTFERHHPWPSGHLLYSSVPPFPTNVDMCAEKSLINSDVFIRCSWPLTTIWELSGKRLQPANLLCVQGAQRRKGEIEVILVWTQLPVWTPLHASAAMLTAVSTVLRSVLNKDLCLFWVSSVALHHNRAPADYLWLGGGQWFMTVFLLLYGRPLLQLSAAANLSKLPQRREHREP